MRQLLGVDIFLVLTQHYVPVIPLNIYPMQLIIQPLNRSCQCKIQKHKDQNCKPSVWWNNHSFDVYINVKSVFVYGLRG